MRRRSSRRRGSRPHTPIWQVSLICLTLIWQVKQKEREQAPKATPLPVDNFLDSHLQKVRETNSRRPEGSVGGQQVGAKPNFGVDEFTLAAHTKAQREVSSGVQGGTIYF